MVRRETTIEDGLRVVLEWLEQQRQEYVQNMRKTWYYIYRRIGARLSLGSRYLPAHGQEMVNGRLQLQRERCHEWPIDLGIYAGADLGRSFYYPGL